MGHHLPHSARRLYALGARRWITFYLGEDDRPKRRGNVVATDGGAVGRPGLIARSFNDLAVSESWL
jgi:hypothetical protein